jgi:hypothetical protein
MWVQSKNKRKETCRLQDKETLSLLDFSSDQGAKAAPEKKI